MCGIEFYPQKEFDEDQEDKADNDKIRVQCKLILTILRKHSCNFTASCFFFFCFITIVPVLFIVLCCATYTMISVGDSSVFPHK